MDIILVILFFIILILLFSKVENHFSYYKILDPEKFKDVNSLFEAQKKLIFYNPRFYDLLYIPLFTNRNKKIENNNPHLKKIGEKIKLQCYLIWLFILIFITIIINL